MNSIDKLNQAISYIENNLCNDIDYNEISRITLSPIAAFQHFFTLTTGVGLSDYIRRRKLTCAAYDLRNSDSKIIDIALKYGYESSDAFSIAFKRLFHNTPSSFRQSDVAFQPFRRLYFELSVKAVENDVRVIRLLDEIVYLPQDCEIGFASCFAAMYMKAESIVQNSQDERCRVWCPKYGRRCVNCGDCPGKMLGAPSLHGLFAVLSGIVFAIPNLEKSNYLDYGIESGFTRVVEEFDDYIDFICLCVGYSYLSLDKAQGKSYIFDIIKQTIDADKAAILQYGEQENWFLIVGYDDENQVLFGYRQGEAYNYDPGYVKNIRIDDWFDCMRRMVLLDEKTTAKIDRNKIYTRLYNIMKYSFDHNTLETNREYILDDNRFNTVPPASLIHEYKKLSHFFFGMVITRCIMGWFFENPYNLNGMDWSRYVDQELNDISDACGNIHDLGHISNGSILGNRYDIGLLETPTNNDTIEKIAQKLRSRTARSVLATVIEITYTHNERIMGALARMMNT